MSNAAIQYKKERIVLQQRSWAVFVGLSLFISLWIKSSQLLYLPSCNLIGHVNSSKISPLGVDHAVITVGFIHKSRCFAKWCKQFKIYLFVIYIINIRSADTYHWAVVVNIHITTYEQLLYMYIYFRTMLALDYPCVYIYIDIYLRTMLYIYIYIFQDYVYIYIDIYFRTMLNIYI